MSVYRLKDKPHGKLRGLPWRAVVPREGQSPLRKQFRSRDEATIWESEQRRVERLKDIPAYRQAQELQTLKNVTVRDLIDDYINSKPNVHPNNIHHTTPICSGRYLREISTGIHCTGFQQVDRQETTRNMETTGQ